MKHLPFDHDVFDFSFCVWSSYNFMLSEADQVRALNEMSRTLKSGGKALIECRLHERPEPIQQVDCGDVSYDYFPVTIEEMETVGRKSSFSSCETFVKEIAGRDRMLCVLRK